MNGHAEEDLMAVTFDDRSGSNGSNGSGYTTQAQQRVLAQIQDVSMSSDDFAPPRPSTDSEERPFEHWYRGEVARNGGVGELRVGRRLEMLEIANYGHKARANQAQQKTGTRRRAESIGLGSGMGPGTRQSFYMDPEDSRGVERVLDETPLTDVEVDESDAGSVLGEYYRAHPRSVSALGFGEDRDGEYIDERSRTPTGIDGEFGGANGKTTRKGTDVSQVSRIPTPTAMHRKASDPPPARTPTPTRALATATATTSTSASGNLTINTSTTARSSPSPRTPRSGSKPPPSSSTLNKSPSRPDLRQQSHSATTPSTPVQKRRAKSPGDSLASATKKTKTTGKQPPVTQARGGRGSMSRRSIAEYPIPGEGDLSNAIPTWTQPVTAQGNWDEVRLLLPFPLPSFLLFYRVYLFWWWW